MAEASPNGLAASILGHGDPRANPKAWAHEYGHLMGLVDDYSLTSGSPEPGHAGHIMAGGAPYSEWIVDPHEVRDVVAEPISRFLRMGKKSFDSPKLGILPAAALVVALLCDSCCHIPLSKPFFVISFNEVELFVEGTGIDPLIAIERGGLRFERAIESSPHEYTASGTGAFVVYDHSCHYSPRKLICDNKNVDISLGAVIFKKNGDILPYNLLPLVTR